MSQNHESEAGRGESQQSVLLAAPESSSLWEARDLLSEEGLDVVSATSGVECINLLRDRQPDLLLLDPDLPWGQGEGVLAMMWQHADIPSVPVVVAKSDTVQADDFGAAPFTSLTTAGDCSPAAIVDRVRGVLAEQSNEPGS